MTQSNQPIEEAPEAVQLAVDLIYLLETNEIDPETALEAIHIVKTDLERKMTSLNQEKTPQK
ncbi:pleiotropic regulatory protein RsmS [Vibrio quintilis]|uniref:Primosomal protein n=1 Tax=Vibrio quintilis TaxID=1117707 RepID=A0A1M7Z1I9_9VIBR|nr:pleiotropic regulatory protein RsmS [Vibrio quintilis]SHO58828.1 hypothetical protein VQ7734_04600 [Vibrio quintilis]